MPDPPSFPPSWEVHITRTAAGGLVNGQVETPKYWAVYGFGLKGIVSLAWGMAFPRVFAEPGGTAEELYDFVIVPPHEISDEEKFKLIRAAVERYFRVHVVREKRRMEVAVLSAPQGKGPGWRELPELKVPPGMGGVMGSGLGGTSRELSGDGVMMADLCEFVERFDHALVVDETGLKGRYSVHVKGDGDFHKLLREQLGVVVTRGWREVEVLRVEKG